jgi:hypothetical protein
MSSSRLTYYGLIGGQAYLVYRFWHNVNAAETASLALACANVAIFFVLHQARQHLRAPLLAVAGGGYVEHYEPPAPVRPAKPAKRSRRDRREELERRMTGLRARSAEDGRLIAADDESQRRRQGGVDAAFRELVESDMGRQRWSAITLSELRPWLRALCREERLAALEALGRRYDDALRAA